MSGAVGPPSSKSDTTMTIVRAGTVTRPFAYRSAPAMSVPPPTRISISSPSGSSTRSLRSMTESENATKCVDTAGSPARIAAIIARRSSTPPSSPRRRRRARPASRTSGGRGGGSTAARARSSGSRHRSSRAVARFAPHGARQVEPAGAATRRPWQDAARERRPDADRELVHQRVDDPAHHPSQRPQPRFGQRPRERQDLLEQLDRRRDRLGIEGLDDVAPAARRGAPQRPPRARACRTGCRARPTIRAPSGSRPARVRRRHRQRRVPSREPSPCAPYSSSSAARDAAGVALELVLLLAEDQPPAIEGRDRAVRARRGSADAATARRRSSRGARTRASATREARRDQRGAPVGIGSGPAGRSRSGPPRASDRPRRRGRGA